MKKSLKITLAVVFSVILIGAFVLLTTLVAANWEYIVGSYNGETYYTSGELEEEYDKGYNDALGNGENNYKALYEEAVKNLSIAQNDKNQLTSQLAQVQSRLDQALNKQELDAEKILELQTDLNEVQKLLTQAENNLSQLQEDYNEILEDNSNLSNDIEELRTENVSLQNQITDLQAQLKAYEDMNLTDYYKLEFVNSSTDLVVSSLYLKEGSSFEVPVIENTKDTWFYGWSTTEGADIVFDFSNFEIDNNYTFYSILGETVPVRLNDNEYCYYYGKNLTVKDILVFDNQIDFSDENLELALGSGITLDTVITDLPTQRYNNGSGVFSEEEYILNAQINFKVNLSRSHYSIEANDTTMPVYKINGLDKYSVNFLSLKNLNFTLTSDKEGFTDTIEFSNFQNNEGKVFSNRIEYSTTGSFAGYNFTITFGSFFTRNSYGFNINFETLPSGIDEIMIENLSFKYRLENSYISILSGAYGAEIPDWQN